MSVEDDPDPVDPKRRYEIYGDYGPASFDDDVENYPHLFDSNGWPLFGNYDPYALTHPVTGLSWHLAPRVPRLDEADPNYGFSYELAMEFQRERLHIARNIKRADALPDAQDPGTDNILYEAMVKKESGIRKYGTLGNRRYLRSHLVPRLDKLISTRLSIPELAIFWGEFCRISERTPAAIDEEIRYHQSVSGGRRDNRDAQVKFYLHWRRRYCDEMDWSPYKANTEFIALINDIIERIVEKPSGFDEDWFQHTRKLDFDVKGNSRYVRGLATCLTRAFKNKKVDVLLASAPEDDPKIPPLDRAAYPLCKSL